MSPSVLEVMAGFLSDLRERVYFLQIGAMDGQSFDPLHALIRRHDWHGVLVEPMAHHFERLTELYRGRPGLRLANIAIGNGSGRQPFYFVDPATVVRHGLPSWVLGISSFSEQHVRDQQVFLREHGFQDIMQYVSKTHIDTITLAELLVSYPLPRVDVLQIDTEGFDYQILKQWDFARQRPVIINLEFARLNEAEKKATTDLLLAEGYSISLQHLDLLALHKDLLGSLKRP